MGTVTARNLQNVQAALGGANPISMNEYYRGGSFVPTSRTTTVRTPASGNISPFNSPPYNFWQVNKTTSTNSSGQTGLNEYYINSVNTNLFFLGSVNISSYTSGTQTTFRSNYFSGGIDEAGDPYSQWRIFYTTATTTSINTGVPSSGTISLNQLLGAENP